MTTQEDLTATFYRIGGETIPEVSKNYKAFEQTLLRETFNADVFFDSIKPQTFRQQLFILKLLRTFNRHEDLLNILLNSPKIISQLALKDHSLIQHISLMDVNYLVERVLAELSYTTRTKLINKLSFTLEDEVKGLELYEAVHDKYGMKAANPLLIVCAEEVIIKSIEKNEVKFRHRQLFRCYKKSEQLLEFYFKKNLDFGDHPKLGQYLCMHNLKLFHNLLKYGVPKIGKKAVVNYLQMYTTEFVKDSNKLRPLLRHDVLWRYLQQEDFAVWFRNLLPNRIDKFEFNWELQKYLKMVPYKIRGPVIFTAFKDLYGFDIWTNRYYLSDKLMEMLPLEDRRKFDLSDCIQYESTDKCIPVMYKLHMPKWKTILENCKINQDYDALLKMLEKFTETQYSMNNRDRCNFVEFVTEFFNFQKFTEKHFMHIDKIIMQLYVNGECCYPIVDTIKKLIEYKISQGLDYSLQMKLFCKFSGYYHIPEFSKKSEEQRSAILQYHSIMTGFDNERQKKTANITFITTVVRFNYQHRYKLEHRIPISIFRDSLNVAIDNITDTYPDFFDIDKLLNSLYREGEEADDILAKVFIASSTKYQPYTQCWFLWKKPYIVENNIDMLFKQNKIHTRFCYELSKLENSRLKNKVTAYALQILKDSNRDSLRICSSIKILSFCTEINLDEYIKRWIPIDCKINTRKEDMKGFFGIQKSLLLSYKNNHCLQGVIPKILHFCNGDYLQFALDPLYYVVNNIPECDLTYPLNELLKRSVSVRKHTLHIIIHVGSVKLKREVLNYFMKNEQNISLRRFIVQKLCKGLQDNRTEIDWDFFRTYLHDLDPEDQEIITKLLSAQNIPNTFYNKYIYLLWEYLCKQGKLQEFQLIDKLDYKKFVFDDSCKAVVSHCLFNLANEYEEQTYSLILNYLNSSSSSEDSSGSTDQFILESVQADSSKSEFASFKVKFLWQCIENSSKTLDSYKFLKMLHNFFYFICKRVAKQTEPLTCQTISNLQIIETMHALLPSLKIRHSKFQIDLLLKTTKLYLSTDSYKFAKSIVDTFKLLLDENGFLIVRSYSNFLKGFLKIVLEERFDDFILNFLEKLLKFDNTTETRVLCIRLLPQRVPNHNDFYRKYFNLVQQLQDDSSVVVTVAIEEHISGIIV